MSKHTKGPWIIGHNSFGMHGITTSDFSVTVVEHIRVDTEEKEANAHLITQAPDMLEMLKCILERSEHLGFECNEISILIKLAEGGLNE